MAPCVPDQVQDQFTPMILLIKYIIDFTTPITEAKVGNPIVTATSCPSPCHSAIRNTDMTEAAISAPYSDSVCFMPPDNLPAGRRDARPGRFNRRRGRLFLRQAQINGFLRRNKAAAQLLGAVEFLFGMDEGAFFGRDCTTFRKSLSRRDDTRFRLRAIQPEAVYLTARPAKPLLPIRSAPEFEPFSCIQQQNMWAAPSRRNVQTKACPV